MNLTEAGTRNVLTEGPETVGSLASRGMILQPPLDHLLIVASFPLNFTDELLHITLKLCEVMVVQLTLPFPDLALELIPVAFDLILIH